MKTFLLLFIVSLNATAGCFERWQATGIKTDKWLNQRALKEKLSTSVNCDADIKRLKVFSGKVKIDLNVDKLGRCMAQRVLESGHYTLGLTKTKGEFLPKGCAIPSKVYEDASVAQKFLECRDGDYAKKTAYLPNRTLKCGANYCFLMKVDQMLDQDLNNCPNCLELRKFIEGAPVLSLNIGNVFARALDLTNNNVSEALLISYYTLGHDWVRPEPVRNLDYFQASLMSLSPKRALQQDNFGPWYHFFGTAFFALSHESVNLTYVGSLAAELLGDLYNWRALDVNEIKRDLQGAKFLGAFKKYLNAPFTSAENDCSNYYRATN